MFSPRDDTASNDNRAVRSSSNAPARNSPLVIVSQRGRHSEASRRIVRAQAARASAAKSRETRARNRRPQHNPVQQQQQQRFQYRSRSRSRSRRPSSQHDHQDSEGRLRPLVNWITDVLHLSAATCADWGHTKDPVAPAGAYVADSGLAVDNVELRGGLLSRRLPVALPRGFANLQKRIAISDGFLVILCRTACFDYGSPGVEDRLNSLLFDIVMTTATHPIHSHLRLACACLTIFQGQRADGASFAGNEKYNLGFDAAWAVAVDLDQDPLKEPESAEAALWAVFIISVTCGSTATFFHRLLCDLMSSLRLQYWEQVRNVLLDFIYPGSFLDEPCRQFYNKLQAAQVPVS